jgi:hypothetical protein
VSPLPYRHNEAVFPVLVAAAFFVCKTSKKGGVKTGADEESWGGSDGMGIIGDTFIFSG